MKKRGFSPVFVVIIIALIGLVAYFFLYRKSLLNMTVLYPTSSPIPTDIGTGWKIHENSELNISVNYPSDWTAGILQGNNQNSIIQNNKPGNHNIMINIRKLHSIKLPDGYESVSKWFNDLSLKKQSAVPPPNNGFYYGPGSDNPAEWYKYYNLENLNNTKINGYPAVVTSASKFGQDVYIVIPHNQDIYEIILSSYRNYNDSTVQKILSTFKFIQ